MRISSTRRHSLSISSLRIFSFWLVPSLKTCCFCTLLSRSFNFAFWRSISAWLAKRAASLCLSSSILVSWDLKASRSKPCSALEQSSSRFWFSSSAVCSFYCCCRVVCKRLFSYSRDSILDPKREDSYANSALCYCFLYLAAPRVNAKPWDRVELEVCCWDSVRGSA